MNPTHTSSEDIFLIPREVFARYRVGRTKGYQELHAPGFPNPIRGSYRLDTLQAWEAAQLVGSSLEDATGTAAGSDASTQTSTTEASNAIDPGPPVRAAHRPGTVHRDSVELEVLVIVMADPVSLPGRHRSRGRSRKKVA
ncbi:MAG: hypothetical protein H0X12_18190 [Nocardioides sp.]|nr:hypothetical protein [Nocardioides sp.]